ncbi:hypothetical protein SAMN02927921_00450 [Sinomicrobium oceani]|uniref:Uncharacterized protein n=1 Tax=Sinomicrobium oceani TaxID=1150368 RepID=A0A1K1M7F7_9FLAO|nr:hypothetical protein [Sinomicrobium oceani]SFW19072.1 hypothetical protein SAMN02927921_00450 [Sinomicrobium oceani]
MKTLTIKSYINRKHTVPGTRSAGMLTTAFFAFLILSMTGCEQQEAEIDTPELSTANATFLVDTDCDCCGSGTETVYFDKDLSGRDIGQYGTWGTLQTVLCENGLVLQNEGQFGSFFRVNVNGQSGWTLGTIDAGITSTDFCTLIADASFEQRCDNPGAPTVPAYSPATPYEEVIGADGFAYGTSLGDYGLGYYLYPSTANVQVIRDILIWKECSTTDSCTLPANATIAYRIKDIDVTPIEVSPGVYDSEITFSWECLSICSE